MSKAVLISIRPEWCEKIINGRKTIEVRKTRPKMNPPFKCYIYCTKPEEKLLTIMKDGDENYGETYHGKPVFIKTEKAPTTGLWDKRQKVIGEFTCNRVTNLFSNSRFWLDEDDVLHTCLSAAEMRKYANGAHGLYGWHISGLKIYNTPKELSEFSPVCRYKNDDKSCPSRRVACSYQKYDCNPDGSINLVECGRTLERPPQSWRYVEELP
jgi:predicted transcriptional regulator